MPAAKTLDEKLTRILADSSCPDFILADAKDADMAYGLSAPGLGPESQTGEGRFRTLDEYRTQIRAVVEQGLVDIVLMSASTSDVLTLRERRFDDSTVTPAVRANDTTDIWLAGGAGRYATQPSLPFRTATIDQAQCGRGACDDAERGQGVDLGLYSITLNNDAALDRETLASYREFRLEAEQKGFRHFLEVFNPNACGGACPQDVPSFVNDSIARILAGVPAAGRPLFLKIPYHGPAAMEALAGYDRRLIVGILGGSAGTTMDAFQMLWEAKRYGARVALYGRKINRAEHQLTFIEWLRRIGDGEVKPAEAVRGYHDSLTKLGIRPHLPLADDLQQTVTDSSYASSTGGSVRAGEPDFSSMTTEEKRRWNRDRWDRILG